MIITPINRDSLILQDIVDTLAQIKVGGVANRPLLLPTGGTPAVSFFVDEAKTQLLFSENATDDPDSFSTSGTTVSYVPPDQKLNFSPVLSTEYAQKNYYVTASFGTYGPSPVNLTYNNALNLMFQNVLTATRKDPGFATADNTVIIVPSNPHKETREMKISDDRALVVLKWDLMVYLSTFSCGFDEKDRLKAGYFIENTMKTALYRDRYRSGNATFLDVDLQGTAVEPFTVLPSEDVLLKGQVRVRSVYMASSTTY